MKTILTICHTVVLLLLVCACNKESIGPESVPNDETSIMAILANNPDHATKIHCYKKLGERYMANTPDKALIYFNAMAREAVQADRHNDAGMANYNAGYLLNRQGDPVNAIAKYLLAYDFFSKAKNDLSAGRASNEIGLLFLAANHFNGAISYFEKALGVFESTGKHEWLAKAYRNMAEAYANGDRPDFGQAQAHLSKALAAIGRMAEARAYHYNWVYNYQGIVHYKAGAYTKAIRAYEQSEAYIGQISGAGERAASYAIAYMNIGESLAALGRYTEADAMLARAEGMAGQLPPRLVAELHNIGGERLQREDRHTAALARLREAASHTDPTVVSPTVERTIRLARRSVAALQGQGRVVPQAAHLLLADMASAQQTAQAAFQTQAQARAMDAALGREKAYQALWLAHHNLGEKAATRGLWAFGLLALAALALAAYRQSQQALRANAKAHKAVETGYRNRISQVDADLKRLAQIDLIVKNFSQRNTEA